MKRTGSWIHFEYTTARGGTYTIGLSTGGGITLVDPSGKPRSHTIILRFFEDIHFRRRLAMALGKLNATDSPLKTSPPISPEPDPSP